MLSNRAIRLISEEIQNIIEQNEELEENSIILCKNCERLKFLKEILTHELDALIP